MKLSLPNLTRPRLIHLARETVHHLQAGYITVPLMFAISTIEPGFALAGIILTGFVFARHTETTPLRLAIILPTTVTATTGALLLFFQPLPIATGVLVGAGLGFFTLMPSPRLPLQEQIYRSQQARKGKQG